MANSAHTSQAKMKVWFAVLIAVAWAGGVGGEDNGGKSGGSQEGSNDNVHIVEGHWAPADAVVCSQEEMCGYDGKTYPNSCAAHLAGVKPKCRMQCPCPEDRPKNRRSGGSSGSSGDTPFLFGIPDALKELGEGFMDFVSAPFTAVSNGNNGGNNGGPAGRDGSNNNNRQTNSNDNDDGNLGFNLLDPLNLFSTPPSSSQDLSLDNLFRVGRRRRLMNKHP